MPKAAGDSGDGAAGDGLPHHPGLHGDRWIDQPPPGPSGEDRQALLDDLLTIITDTTVPDEQIGGLIRGEKIGWPRLRAAVAQAVPRLPRDHGHLAALDGSYGYLRQFTPQVLAAVPIRRRHRRDRAAGSGADPARAQRHGRLPRTGRVRARAVARLPGHCGEVRQYQRISALLGVVRAAGVAGWAAHR